MVDIERAPLPPPSKRGRKPKADSMAKLDGWRSAIEATRQDPDEDAWGSNVVSYEGRETIPVDGWTGAQEVKRFPTEGYTMLVGGAFNGQERDMRPYRNAKFVALPLDNGCVEWYERGEVSGYVWIASVTPQGIELRETAL